MKKILIIFIFVLACTVSQAQQTISSKQYKEAFKMAETAKKELLAGNYNLADSLIRQSINLYPTLPVFDYAIALGTMPNIVGANQIMDLAAQKVKGSPGYKDDPMGTLIYVKNWVGLTTKTVPYDEIRKLYNVYDQIQKVNVILGERRFIIASMQKAVDLQLPPNPASTNDLRVDIFGQQIIRMRLALLQNNVEEALKLAEEMPQSAFYTEEVKAQAIKNIRLADCYAHPNPENNAKATALLKDNPGDEYAYFTFLTSIGANAEARKYYSGLTQKLKAHPSMQYYLAVMDITDGNFTGALAKLKIVADGYRSFSQEVDLDLIINRHLLYKAYGDAYAGLKDYNKAIDSYKLSLMYNPDYKPTKDALTSLDVKIAEASSTDHTAPVITLLEPAFDPQMKFTSAGNSVMIKGTAKDLSGIKEVTINGTKVYFQKSGDFWGDVNLVNGPNLLQLVVTDIAGHKAIKKVTVIRQNTTAQNTAIIPVSNNPGQNYCLLIAAQNYNDNAIPSLDHPIADAIKLKLVLKSAYDFDEKNIISLFNPQTSDIRRQLLELSSIIQPEDNLVIFYAGHGIWVDSEKKGYWLMTDAEYKDHSTWLPNKEMLEMIAKIPARHTLLITDACFSGSVFKSRGLKAGMPALIKEMTDKITRVAITSGNDTEVPDESIFMKYLIKALNDNQQKYLTAQKMFIDKILEAVMTETNTEPRYGTLELAGHVGGDFIFKKKD